ncbi:uncharacterized protein LOC141607441 [Silene latifolia]|uniref:uncharacterized protein LOC141607441 n=1 Tax=Silene latifolia TaxID=37657 RepID=UPI003D7899F5
MNGLIWNCRGINNALSPIIPKIRALTSSNNYDFLFLCETKCTVEQVNPLFRSAGFVESVGVNAVGSSGGLWCGWKSGLMMNYVTSCNNFIIIKNEMNVALPWYLILFYGEPDQALRLRVFELLGSWLNSLEHPFIIVGDFNQVEFSCDKLSGKTGSIAGALGFHKWRVLHELVDIPFKGHVLRGVIIGRVFGGFNLVKNSCKKPYKIESWNLDNVECLSLINKNWTTSFVGSAPFRLARKLAFIRNILRKWSIDKRQVWSREWDRFDVRLQEAMDYSINTGGAELSIQVNDEVTEFARATALYWKQRAKLKWTVDGDTCTKFFFNWVKGRAGRNYILSVKDLSGCWTYDPICIGNLFYSYFYNLYNPIHNDQLPIFSSTNDMSRLDDFEGLFRRVSTKIKDDDIDFLSKPFSKKDVRRAVFQLGALKSPGPDGFPALFFQRCWHTVKDDVSSTVLSILNSGLVLKELNITFIALIPKCASPEKVDDYRPISLCNVIMKIVTRCITNRLSRVMSYLVGEFQNAFVAGRHIGDNVLLAHEAIQNINKHTSGSCGRFAFKADMSKAYDRIRWDFLKRTLSCFGFPSFLINLIMNVVSTVSYEVLVNGAPLK